MNHLITIGFTRCDEQSRKIIRFILERSALTWMIFNMNQPDDAFLPDCLTSLHVMVRLVLVLISFPCLLLQAKDAALSFDSTRTNPPSRFLVFPFMLKSPETKLGFGIASAYFFKTATSRPDDRTSDVSLIGLYTLRKQVVIAVNSSIYFKGEDQIFRTQISGSYYPDRFWGLGNSTTNNSKEDYSIHQYLINPQFLFRTIDNLYLGVTMEFQHIYDFEYVTGGIFDQQLISGRYGGNTSGAGLLITWDTRNTAYSPDRGSFVELNSSKYTGLLGSDFDFWTYALDLRKFTRITKSTVLAAQTYLKANRGNVPIRNLSMLGGSELMRGYWKGRFTDKNMIAMQMELRQFIAWRIGVTGFAGIGQVSDRLSGLGPDHFHWSAGGGIRFMVKKNEKLNLRVDYGFGEHSSGLYVLLKEAF